MLKGKRKQSTDNKASIRAILRCDTNFGNIREFKISMINMLKALKGKEVTCIIGG